MTRCDMFAALTDGSSIYIQDYYSYNHDTPQTDAQLGGTEDYTQLSSSMVNGLLTVVVKRKLSTGDQFDQDIIPDVHGNICWAYLTNRNGWLEHSKECK